VNGIEEEPTMAKNRNKPNEGERQAPTRTTQDDESSRGGKGRDSGEERDRKASSGAESPGKQEKGKKAVEEEGPAPDEFDEENQEL
jgi:hypothetical protein